MRWYQRFLRRGLTEKHLDAELRFHLEQQIADYIAAGMKPEDARRRARLEFGGIDLVKEECREVGTTHFIEAVAQDMRYSLRQLRRNPGFTIVAVLTLALGIGVNTAIFSIVYDVLLKPLPFPKADELVWVARTQPPFPPDWSLPFSGPDFLDLRDQNHSFQDMAGVFWSDFSLIGHGEPKNVRAALVTANFFRLLGVQPILGRGFLSGEDQQGRNLEIVLSYNFWQSEFGSQPDVIGKTVDLSEQTYTIVGVMPRGFAPPSAEDDVWVPLVVPKMDRGNNSYRSIARLKEGVTLAQARADLSAIVQRLALAYPESDDKAGVLLMPLQQRKGQFIRSTLLILLGAVGFVLLIACANVANLLLARGELRFREMAVRSALGAGRRRLLAQLLVESVMLALGGGAAGVLVASWSINLLRALKPNSIPDLTLIGLDLPVLWFTFGVSVLTGLIFGVVPSFHVSHIQLNEALKASGTAQGRSRQTGRTRNGLVVAEIAISLVLLSGAGLLIRSFARITGIDPGFDSRQLVRFTVWLQEPRYPTRAKIEEFYRPALERIQAVPGVESAAVSYPAPPSSGESDGGFDIEGQLSSARSTEPHAVWHPISPDYFHVMRTAILVGRGFTKQDTMNSPRVAIINETLARHFFPHQNPIGRRLRLSVDGDWWQIVGVAADQAYAGWDSLYSDEVYMPFAREPWSLMTFVVRTKLAPEALMPELRQAIWSVDKDLPVLGMQTMEQALDVAYAPRRFDMALLLAFALLAVALAAIGIYGVMSYSVAQRTREIGIRAALGAEKADVVRLLVGEGMKLALAGLGLGLTGGLALTRFLSGMLYGVKSSDPLTFALVSLVLACVALVASYIPARRATKVDPMVALRYE